MLSFISGKIKYKTENSLIILVCGLGYEVFLGKKATEKQELNSDIELFLYQDVREDALNLFGFKNRETLNLFKHLVSISGIGPKSAMSILEIASVQEIISSIQRNDPHLLTKVSGVGKKTAERIVLELKNKFNLIPNIDPENSNHIQSSSDEIDALISLGYSASQARDALGQVSPEIKDIGDRVREALKRINRM
ncbi:MAG: Holliday junction branch migration protein RuvA [bacterium]